VNGAAQLVRVEKGNPDAVETAAVVVALLIGPGTNAAAAAERVERPRWRTERVGTRAAPRSGLEPPSSPPAEGGRAGLPGRHETDGAWAPTKGDPMDAVAMTRGAVG
jgi:Acyl-CoA carboxylase epsilon subunit